MKKAWQIWSVFLVCLSGLVLAMLWLSWKTIELDSAREQDRVETELARRQAELQERISSALYRMDLKLLPLISQEASRPHYLYQSYYDATNPTVIAIEDDPAAGFKGGNSSGMGGGKGGGKAGEAVASKKKIIGKVASPLLNQTPEFVLLHFQLQANDAISSPQYPVGWASKLIAATQKTTINPAIKSRMAEAKQLVSYSTLLSHCPDAIPDLQVEQGLAANSTNQIYNVPAVERLQDNLVTQNYTVDIPPKGSKSQWNNKFEIQQQRGAARVNEDFNRRRESTRQVASQGGNLNSIGNWSLPNMTVDVVQQSAMQPVWIEDQLILYRRVDGKEAPVFQCCWLDWPAIEQALKTDVADLLPAVDFEPVTPDTDLNIGTALTTLPVQLIVDSPKLLSSLSIKGSRSIEDNSGLKMALLLSWLGLGLAAVASAFLLRGVMKLSERRAAFVSAVTHELRTPLTTFKMYSEMLAEKMVPEPKQQEYANTLKLQADRLSHLVENVLQYARLERSSTKLSTETVTVSQLLDRFESRLGSRAEQAEMKLETQFEGDTAKTVFATQPGTIEQIIFNLVDNACKYAKPNSKNLIELTVSRNDNRLRFSVRDYGPGVSPKFKKTMFQPFSKSDLDAANSAPGVGLGLALCQRKARSLNGKLYHEDLADGATFVLELPVTNG